MNSINCNNLELPKQTSAYDGLGQVEHSAHNMFSLSRIAGEDFVYSSSNELFVILEAYCSDQQSNKPPLLIIGDAGTGKTSLLSNWLSLRQRKKSYARHNSDEHVFWHAVGCSRPSCYENNLIRRLILDLKERFNIARELPFHQDKLRWVLPRFLEIAAKKGRVIIVIDGVNRLTPDELNDSVLSWLPLTSQPNVKIILSATVPRGSAMFSNASSSAGSVEEEDVMRGAGSIGFTGLEAKEIEENIASRKSGVRLLKQLERRHLQILRLRNLERSQAESIIFSFIQKTVELDMAAKALLPTTVSSSQRLPGLLLYASQVKSLLAHKSGTSAQFLRLLLSSLYLLCKQGFSIWQLWDTLIQASDVLSLLKVLIGVIEGGHEPRDGPTTAGVKDNITREGGLKALFKLYPWHPSLTSIMDLYRKEKESLDDLESSSDVSVFTAKSAGNPSSVKPHAEDTGSRAGSHHEKHRREKPGDKYGSKKWLQGVEMTESKIKEAKKKVRLMTDLTLQSHYLTPIDIHFYLLIRRLYK